MSVPRRVTAMRRLSMGELPRLAGLLTTLSSRVDSTTSVLMTFSTWTAVTLGSCTSLRTRIATSGSDGSVTRLALRSSRKPERNFFSNSIWESHAAVFRGYRRCGKFLHGDAVGEFGKSSGGEGQRKQPLPAVFCSVVV